MTSARKTIGVSSQGARVSVSADDTPDAIGQKVNEALTLIRDDIQRLAGVIGQNPSIGVASGTDRVCVTKAGQARVWAISDTATTGSGAGDYHTLTLKRNGVTVGSLTYDTRRTEVPAFQTGCYLGEVAVGERDVLIVNVDVTGAPAPTLTGDNFCLFVIVQGG